MGVSFKMRKRRETGNDCAKRGSEGGRGGFISHSHAWPWMAIPGKPSARLTRHVKLIVGQRFLRFSILKETPMAPVFKGGQAQRSVLVGDLNLMGLPGRTMRRMVPSKGFWPI
jgi:hypothetical protein